MIGFDIDLGLISFGDDGLPQDDIEEAHEAVEKVAQVYEAPEGSTGEKKPFFVLRGSTVDKNHEILSSHNQIQYFI